MKNVILSYSPSWVHASEQLEKLRKYVKECLWNLGYGYDQHLHQLKNDFFFERRAKKYPYLMKVMHFFDTLDGWERRYFINEVLEKGQHYVFWHNDMSSRAFLGSEKRTLRKIKEGLFNEATPF